MMKHDLSIEVLFKFMDKDGSDDITIEELTRNSTAILNDNDCRILFDAVDADKSGKLSYAEIINELAKLNSAYALKKINETLTSCKTTVESVFSTFDRNKNG